MATMAQSLFYLGCLRCLLINDFCTLYNAEVFKNLISEIDLFNENLFYEVLFEVYTPLLNSQIRKTRLLFL